MTLRARLALWTVVIFTLILWTFGGVFWLYDSSAIRREFAANLDGRGLVIAQRAASELPGLSQERLRRIVREEVFSGRIGYFFVDVFDEYGQHVLQNAPMIVEPESIPIDSILGVPGRGIDLVTSAISIPNPSWTEESGYSSDGPSIRAIAVGVKGIDGRSYIVFLAASDLFERSRLEELRNALLLMAALVPILSFIGGWFVAGIAVAPFAALRTMAGELRPDRLGHSLEMDASSPEVADLAEELEEARRKIREAFKAQERFLSNVSHEIKTPIAVMRIESQTIETEGLPDQVRYFVESVDEEMKRLGNLVESFLTLTRIEDGHGTVRGKRYAVNDLVMDSVEQCAIMANQRSVWLRPGLFETEETIDVAVAGDPELLTTMLGNLIRNAIIHSPQGAGVRIELETDADSVRIGVADEGPGIPPDKIEAIFDRFAQGTKKDRKGRGHGLGLAIARGIAELHHGTIGVKNLPEKGCVFRVTLPRKKPG